MMPLSHTGSIVMGQNETKRLNLEQVREINAYIAKFKDDFNESIQLNYNDKTFRLKLLKIKTQSHGVVTFEFDYDGECVIFHKIKTGTVDLNEIHGLEGFFTVVDSFISAKLHQDYMMVR